MFHAKWSFVLGIFKKVIPAMRFENSVKDKKAYYYKKEVYTECVCKCLIVDKKVFS